MIENRLIVIQGKKKSKESLIMYPVNSRFKTTIITVLKNLVFIFIFCAVLNSRYIQNRVANLSLFEPYLALHQCMSITSSACCVPSNFRTEAVMALYNLLTGVALSRFPPFLRAPVARCSTHSRHVSDSLSSAMFPVKFCKYSFFINTSPA